MSVYVRNILPIIGIETAIRNLILIAKHFQVTGCELTTGKAEDFCGNTDKIILKSVNCVGWKF